jgi:hypothetical protein
MRANLPSQRHRMHLICRPERTGGRTTTTDESVAQPPRTVPHDRVVAAMELVYGPRPDLRPDIGIPAAQDDEPDDQFINSVGTQGITGDRGQFIGDGHAMCDAYCSARTIGLMLHIEGQGFDKIQASNVMLAGLRAYRPERLRLGDHV